MKCSLIPVLISLVALAAPAAAAELTVDLHRANGAPVRDAVVSLVPVGGGAPAAATRLAGPFQMSQEKIQFHPFVLLVPVGATVAFPNLDKVRHHVYSFSPARTFELKLFGQEDHRSVTFDKAGVVALGCNIHDRMLAYIYVSDTPYAARSDDQGRVQLHNVPDGAFTLKVWHPFQKTPAQTLSRPLALKGEMTQSLTLELRDPPAAMSGMGG